MDGSLLNKMKGRMMDACRDCNVKLLNGEMKE